MRTRSYRLLWALMLTFFLVIGPTLSAVSAQSDATPTADDSAADGVAAYRDATRLQESIFGPEVGTLVHDPDAIAFAPADVNLQNFYAKVRVEAPYDGEEQTWDAGFVFRQGRDFDWRVVIYSSGVWDLRLGSGEPLDAGEFEGLEIGEGDANDIELAVDGETGFLAINGEEVASFDLSRRMITGNVSLGSTFVNDTFRVGAESAFSRFQIWELDPTEPAEISRSAVALMEEGRDIADTEDPLAESATGAIEESAESITAEVLGVEVDDFYTRAEVTNPRSHDDSPFDFGLIFRNTGGNEQFRIVFVSDGSWFFSLGVDAALQSENFLGLNTGEGETNIVEVVASGDDFAFAINGSVIGSGDISAISEAGEISLGVGFYPVEDVVEGGITEFTDFAAWSLTGATPEPTDEVETPEATEEAETPEATEESETPEATEEAETPEATEEIEGETVPEDPEEALAYYLDLTDRLDTLYGPESGELEHESDSISYANANTDITDFVLYAEFVNPYAASSGDWDFGVLFRVADEPPHLRLIIGSTGDWYLTPSADDPIQQGTIENLNVRNGQVNTLDLVVVGDVGYFAVNGEFVEELDLSLVTNSGDVAIATSFFEGTFQEGAVTEFEDYVIWEIPAGSSTDGPDETPAAGGENTYESEQFGYTVDYTDDWSIEDEESDENGDWVRFGNGVSTVDFTGFESDLTPAECLADEFTYYESADGYSNAEPALDNDDEELTGDLDDGGVWGTYWFTFTSGGEDPVDYAAYVECRPIEEGTSLVRIVQFVVLDSFEDETDARAELISGFRLPSSGGEETPTEEADPEETTTAEAGGELIVVNISTLDGDSIAGLATIEESGSRSIVSVLGLSIDDGTIVMIQEGSCADLSGEAAFLLTEMENGISETTIRVELAELTDGDFAITFSESLRNLDEPLACGDIGG